MSQPSPALFLDRDGVVNREIGYLHRPEQVEFLPGIFELCRRAAQLGYKIILITNQSGIARALYSEEQFHQFMAWMIRQFQQQAVILDAYYYCPHHPEHGVGKFRIDCPDRKPNPGMILTAAREHELDLSRSILIGDRCSDITAGAAAGVGSLVLLKGTEPSPCPVPVSYRTVTTLLEAAALLGRSPK